ARASPRRRSSLLEPRTRLLLYPSPWGGGIGRGVSSIELRIVRPPSCVALTSLGAPLMSHGRLFPGIFWSLSPGFMRARQGTGARRFRCFRPARLKSPLTSSCDERLTSNAFLRYLGQQGVRLVQRPQAEEIPAARRRHQQARA